MTANSRSDPAADAPTISVIGVGEMGSAIARALATARTDVMIANRRGPASLADFAGDLGPAIRPVPVSDALLADIVILTVPWTAVADVLTSAPPWSGRLLLDCTNPVDFLAPGSPEREDPANPLGALGLRIVDLDGRLSSEVVAELAPSARVVKTLNHLEPGVLTEPRTTHGRTVAFLAGDDPAARAATAALLGLVGLQPVDLGPLSSGGRLFAFPGGSLMGLDLVHPDDSASAA